MMMMMNAQPSPPPPPKQLVVVVEGTAALGPTWPLLLAEYVEKVVRAFCGVNVASQKHTVATGEMALIVFHSHGSQNGCLVQKSGWTSSVDTFFRWLSLVSFSGGGFGDAAIAEGLAEALQMCCPGPNVTQIPQGRDCQKHCILIAGSNPRRIPTPVHSPPVHNFKESQGNNGDMQAEQWWLADADTVAQAFPPCSVSLSVVAPRQLPKLRTIFSQAKRGARTSDPVTELPKQYLPHLVLLSDGFLEARMALHRTMATSSSASNVLTAKIEHQSLPVAASTASGQLPVAGVRPSSGVVTGLGVMSGRPGSNLPIQPVTVKTEAVTAGTLSALLHTNSHSLPPMHQLPSSGPVPSQDVMQSSFTSLTSSDPAQDFKVLGNIPASQPLRAVGASSLPSNSMLAHSPSQSRHTIGSPSLAPVGSPLSGLQSAGGGVPVSQIMATVTGGSNSMAATPGTIGVIGQPGGVGMVPSTLGVGQGVGIGTGHSGYSSGTSNLGTNAMMGSLQPPSAVNIGVGNPGQGPVSGLVGQGGLVSSSNQMIQNGHGLPVQSIISGVGNVVGSTGTGAMMPLTGIPQSPGQVQTHGISNTGVPAPLHTAPTTGTPPQQPASNSLKYTRLWEGILAGQRKGNLNPIPICKLQGYRQTSSPDTLAGDWPPTMQIMRLIPQEYMNQKDYQRKAELLVFRPLTEHDFLVQLAEKKLLPRQTLLLASTDKPGRMIGMLFPGDMVQIKPQVPSQQLTASSGAAPQAVGPNNFSQNPLQGQLQNQIPNGQLANQLANQQPRSQLLPGPTSLHGTGFLP